MEKPKIEIAIIPCKSFTDTEKTYNVLIDLTNKVARCDCKFSVKYGFDHDEACRHIEIVIASIKIFPILFDRYLQKDLKRIKLVTGYTVNQDQKINQN